MASSSELQQSASVRAELEQAYARGWRRLAAPGTWWDGATRLQIAAEARRAPHCALCTARMQALSWAAVAGRHDSDSNLPAHLVEIVHRVRNDASRITESWVLSLAEQGVREEEYVELIAIVATTTALDTYRTATLQPLDPLPEPIDGAPSRHRPAGAKRNLAWVSTLAPEDVGKEDHNPYANPKAANIHRALSLVPHEVSGFFDLVETFYLPGPQMRVFDEEFRAVTHAQSELIAARISAINRCIY